VSDFNEPRLDATIIHRSEAEAAMLARFPEHRIRQHSPATLETISARLIKRTGEIDPTVKALVMPTQEQSDLLREQAAAVSAQPPTETPSYYAQLSEAMRKQAEHSALRSQVAKRLRELQVELASGNPRAKAQLAAFLDLDARENDKVVARTADHLEKPDSEYSKRKASLANLQSQTTNPEAQRLFPDLVLAGQEKIPQVQKSIPEALNNLAHQISGTEELKDMVRLLRLQK
jgi:molybdopterin converting factor small subunit